MSTKKRIAGNTAWLVGLAVSLACNAASARDVATGAATVRKEAKVGMLTGVATGAAAGGPIGAAVGLLVGGIIGDSAGMTKVAEQHSSRLALELTDARSALAKATEEADNDAVLAGLTEKLHAQVLFKTGSARLQSDIAVTLEQVGAILASHPALSVQLHGFADPRGSAEYNVKLSQERVAAVEEALVRGGMAAAQIHDTAHGAGESTAAAGDLEAYAWERRVSVAIVSTSLSQAVAAAN